MTFMAPVLCFYNILGPPPFEALAIFSVHSTAVYAALSPLSALGHSEFILATQKAQFLVTGDVQQNKVQITTAKGFPNLYLELGKFFKQTHPDQLAVQVFEISVGMIFATICLYMFQVSFFGLCLAFILLPIMHHVTWDHPWVGWAAYLPFSIILLGIGLSAMSLLGVQTVFFGYGFHF